VDATVRATQPRAACHSVVSIHQDKGFNLLFEQQNRWRRRGKREGVWVEERKKKKWKDATALLIRINKRLFKGVHYDNLQIRNSSSDPLVNAVS